MNSRKMPGLTALAVLGAIGATTGTVSAQQVSENIVSEQQDWAVYEDADPKECWAVAAPKETVNTKDGRVVAVTRGEILLMVFFRPEAGVSGQIAFTGGYPFADGSTVNVVIGDSEFELYTEGEWAWPATPQDDTKIITAMKRGADAVVSAVSSRGTTTKDTFSLLGFTAAYDDAEARCS